MSLIGDGVYIVAIAWQVYRIANRPSALAAVGIAWSIPQVAFTLAGGVLADRFDRRRMMIAGDLIRFVAIGAMGLLSLRGELTIPLTVALAAVYGSGQSIFQPSFTAIVPTIVSEDLLVEANSLAQFVQPVARTLIGPLIGGLLVAASPGWAFIVDAASFAFSAVMIWLMRVRPADREGARASYRDELLEGIRYVRARRWLLIAMFGATVSLLCTWGPWETLLPFIVKNDLHGGAAALGLVFGAGGLGSVTAALVMGQRGTLPRRPVTVLYVSWAFAMFMGAGLGIVAHVWQAAIVALVAESGITVLIVVWFTLLQRLVPGELLGRVSSLDWMITVSGVPLSFAIVGPVASAIGARTTMVWAGVLGGLVTIALMFLPGALDPERDGSLAEPSAG